jgi:hypothetical protein
MVYKRIGAGSFSSVYRKGNSDHVLIVSTDPVKECMGLGWFPDSRLFPKVTRLSYNDDGTQTFTMKYYDKVTSPKLQLNERSYKLYKALRKLDVTCQDANLLHDKWRKAFNGIPVEFKVAKKALSEAVDALTNYGPDISFEISPRNIAVTKAGNLVLLDCFFLRSALSEKKSIKRSLNSIK